MTRSRCETRFAAIVGGVGALCGAMLCSAVLAGGAQAQTYPDKPVKWVVPFPPGGPTDILSRIFAASLTEDWGQQVVVDNRGGAAGMVGSAYVAKAVADGYTIMLGTQSTHGSNAIFFPQIAYDTVKDFQPLTLVGTSCLALVVHPSVPATSVSELVTWLKGQGTRANYASAASGSSQHVAGELFNKRAGTQAVHVPYKGSAPAVQDLVAGHVSFMFDNLPSSMPMARTGKTRALAQTCAKRSAGAPDLPTMKEAGIDDFVIEGWYGILAPAGTPRPIVDKLSADINAVLRRPASMERWKQLGFDPIGTTPEVFAERIKGDVQLWADLIKLTGVKVE
jgi:tripartite-type tricarboxylate transporter receptor subunit TctC